MGEYISREAVVLYLKRYSEKEWNPSSLYGMMTSSVLHKAERAILELPAADVQPVKRGEWDFQGYQLFKCTNCKEIFTQNQLEAMQNHIDQEEFTFPNFCPHCGADMRGSEND